MSDATWYPPEGGKARILTSEQMLGRLFCGDILLMSSNSILGRVIRFFTHNDVPEDASCPIYSHAELIKGMEYDRGTCIMTSWSAEPRGLIPRETGRHFTKITWGEVWRNLDFTSKEYQKIIETVQSMMRKGGEYDYGAFFAFCRELSHFFTPKARAYTCGEAVVRAMRRSGCDLFPADNAEKISPVELAWRLRQIAGNRSWQKISGRWVRIAKWDLRPEPLPAVPSIPLTEPSFS